MGAPKAVAQSIPDEGHARRVQGVQRLEAALGVPPRCRHSVELVHLLVNYGGPGSSFCPAGECSPISRSCLGKPTGRLASTVPKRLRDRIGKRNKQDAKETLLGDPGCGVDEPKPGVCNRQNLPELIPSFVCALVHSVSSSKQVLVAGRNLTCKLSYAVCVQAEETSLGSHRKPLGPSSVFKQQADSGRQGKPD